MMEFDEGQLETLLNFAFRLCGNLDDAKDLVQEAILKFLKIENDHILNPLAYVKRTMVNLVIDEHRKKHRVIPIENLPEVQVPPEEFAKIVHVQDCLAKLPGVQRIVAVLFYIEGYSTSEISDMLGISRGTVKSHLFRARENLKKCLEVLI